MLISAADMGKSAASLPSRPGADAGFADEASYTNATVASLVADARAHAYEWAWARRAAMMARRPTLVLTSDDGLAPTGNAAVAAIKAAGGPQPVLIHMATDHSYDDHRIALAATVINWLDATFPKR